MVLVYLSDLDGAMAAKKELLAMMGEKLKPKNIEPEVITVQGKYRVLKKVVPVP